ncbi:hypothetical protein [Pseudalkalibacillus caeni]|uniref:Uncharacterized protein n=1 Tax=Exobacillus caeni TaxID=2574798 RepID=A0A5R9F928_9BACL|nr:hypothetical protein [Pseudalkalibacillus caeni]TLS38770.1 hypothetical protein FCL54_00165 [Pseudalkalibacillus caeni]
MKEKNKFSKLLYFIGFGILLCGFIIGLMQAEDGFIAFFTPVVAAAFLGVIYIALGEIIDRLNRLEQNPAVNTLSQREPDCSISSEIDIQDNTEWTFERINQYFKQNDREVTDVQATPEPDLFLIKWGSSYRLVSVKRGIPVVVPKEKLSKHPELVRWLADNPEISKQF